MNYTLIEVCKNCEEVDCDGSCIEVKHINLLECKTCSKRYYTDIEFKYHWKECHEST